MTVFKKEQQIEEIFHSRLSEVCNYYFINGKLSFAALRFSKRGYRKDGDITNLPLYLVCKTRDLL